ncbi:cation:proton antiporter [Patescibacteria group bacterium]|nr:cation:proton antiporter [Patescibacteria group bacterium]
MNSILMEIGFLFLFATVAAFLVRLLKQPVLPFFIIAGIIAGPILHLISPSPLILSLSEAGIAFLLFIVGIEMNFGKIEKSSKVIKYAALTAMAQLIVFALLGLLLGRLFHLNQLYSFYLALAITFSSTMIVVKLLTDKGELLTIHGKSAITILLIQDVFAIIALIFISSLNELSFIHLGSIFLKTILLFLVAFALRKLAYHHLFKFAACSQELLFLLTISIVLGFGILSNYLGLSIAIGAFVAGVSLAGSDFAYEISIKVRPLRDFFATLFLVTLGLLIVPTALKGSLLLIIAIILVSVLLKPLFIFFSLLIFNFRASSSLRTALYLGQISEFVLVAGLIGIAHNQIDERLFSIITASFIATAVISSYFITYMRFFTDRLNDLAKKFERPGAHLYEKLPKKLENHAVIFGYHRTGEKIVETLKKMGITLIVVDFNPDIIDELEQKDINHLYGDMADKEILDKMNLHKTSIVVSTIPNVNQNIAMIEQVRKSNPKATIYVTAKEIEEALELYETGASYVILPHFLGGEETSLLIERFSGDEDRLVKIKEAHLNELKKDLGRFGKK